MPGSVPWQRGRDVGLANMFAQAGGLLGSVAYGYIVERFRSYDAPFVPIAAMLLVATLLWTRIDAAEDIRAVLPKAEPAAA